MCLEAQLWLNWLGTTRFYQVYQTDRARTERLKVFKLIRFTKRTVGYPGPSRGVIQERGPQADPELERAEIPAFDLEGLKGA